MKKGGTKYALIGLAAGVLVGLVMTLVQSLAKKELLGLLEDEVRISTGCDFKTDKVSISFLSLGAVAIRPRIECQGSPVLEFERLITYFSLRNIPNRTIDLTNLILLRGYSAGVGPDSPTFKFIDHLTAPIPPERDTPDRWKARLIRLEVIDGRFTEPVPRGELTGSNLDMVIQLNEKGDFDLFPQIESLNLVLRSPDQPSGVKNIKLGQVSGSLTITDDQLVFNSVQTSLNNGRSEMKGVSYTDEDDRLEAVISYELGPDAAFISDYLQIPLKGEARTSGSLGNPGFSGNFTPAGPVPFTSRYAGFQLPWYDELTCRFSFNYNHGDTLVDVQEFSMRGPDSSIYQITPFTYRKDILSGKLKLNIGSMVSDKIEIRDLDMELDLKGPFDDMEISGRGNLSSFNLQGTDARDLDFSFDLKGDQIDFLVLHDSPEFGFFSVQGIIDSALENIKPSKMEFSHFSPLPYLKINETQIARDFRITGRGTLEGENSITGLNAASTELQGIVNIAGNELPVSGKSTLKGGNLSLILADPSDAVKLDSVFGLAGEKSKVALSVSDLKKAGLFKSDTCINAESSLDYTFETQAPLAGNGKLDLKKLEFGCQQYEIKNRASYVIPIRSGSLDLQEIRLGGSNSSIVVRGSASQEKGWKIEALGSFGMASLIEFVPAVDDLRGQLEGSFGITGPLEAPDIKGSIKISDGGFEIESANFSASAIEGDIDYKNFLLHINTLKGSLNGGEFDLSGDIMPLSLDSSELHLRLRDILYSPFEDSNIIFSGDMKLTKFDTGTPGLSGKISIESGEVRKNLEIQTLLRSLPDYIFAAQQNKPPGESALPPVDLDLKISATRNLFVFTTWLNAELKSDLHVTGNMQNPAIRGSLETINGWFGLKDRKFEITSGAVSFKPGQLEPKLDLTGEAYIQSRAGDNVLVIFEATGPLTSPKVTISSDRGLSEKDLLSLITSGANLSDSTKVNSLEESLNFDTRFYLEDQSIFNPGRLFRNLTRIDTLSIEPTFNYLTGSIEPTIVGRKQIFEKLYIEGESFFGSTDSLSRIKTVLNVTPSLNASVLAESRSTREDTPLEANLTYTILANQKKFLSIHVDGNENVSETNILNAVRINENSRIPCAELPKLETGIRKYYNSLGYFKAAVTSLHSADAYYCREVAFHITEGPRSYIQSVSLEGDPVDNIIDTQSYTQPRRRTAASKNFTDRTQARLISQLRAEGYISSRVRVKLDTIPDSDSRHMRLIISLGKPVSFIFRGNTAFTPEEFLETINLFNRRLPLGNNTINILVENMDRLYRASGYLYVTIKHTREEDPATGRINYLIDINEENRVGVSKVLFKGNTRLNESFLKSAVLKQERSMDYDEIFNPTFAQTERLKINVDIIQDIYVEEGYPEASVNFDIVPDNDGNSVRIEYNIDEGTEQKADWLSAEGIPEEVELPEAPEAPYSIAKANRYIDQVLSTLNDYGYFGPSISSRFDFDTQKLILEFDPGVRTDISSIEFEGNLRISAEVIRHYMEIGEGEAWSQIRINNTKRKLLRLGLFSRVEIVPKDGEINSPSEAMLIKLDERALQTLEVGGGINSAYGFHAFGRATDKSLFKDGRSISLLSDLYYDPTESDISQGVAGLIYTDPSLLSSEYVLTEDLRYQKFELSTQEFDLDRISLASYIYRNWNESTTFSLGHTIQQENLENVSPGAILSPLDEGVINLSFLSGSVTYDERDAPLNPTRGFALNFDYKLVTEILGSDADFYALGGRVVWVRPLHEINRRFTFAAASRLASAWTAGDTPDIPISQRYYLGGRSTIRGFRENSLGPRGDDGSVIGGDLLAAGNFELRYLIADNTEIHTFIDAGNVYLKGRGTDLADLRYSTGVGVRYLSPIGPIGIDIGHPLDEKRGEPSVRLHFNVGSPF